MLSLLENRQLGVSCKGCIPSQKCQTYHLCGKMQSSKKKTKIRGNQRCLREHDDTTIDIIQVGVWQILQLHIHNNTLNCQWEKSPKLHTATTRVSSSSDGSEPDRLFQYLLKTVRPSKASQGAMGIAVRLMRDHYLVSSLDCEAR